MKLLEINVISDIHYYSEASGNSGKAYEKALAKSQKLLHGSSLVLKACFDEIAQDDSTDILVIAGDLTNNGEKQAHTEVIELLTEFKKKGKRVYTITATHDYRDCGFTAGYEGDREINVPTYKREELFELYRQFGADEAIALHRQSMSYVVQLAEGYRLFALNDDTNLQGKSGFSDECFAWITQQVEKAKQDGQFIIAFTHHPLISPSPVYSLIGKNDMMGGWEKRREQLADMGVNFIITGHTHMQSIRRITTKNGNDFYDISVASPIGYPGTYRKLTFNGENRQIKVDTVEFARQSPLLIDGIPLYDALKKQLTGMITDVVQAAATDRNKFASMATAFSIKEEKGKTIGLIIKPAAKRINTVSVARVAKSVKKRAHLSAADLEQLRNMRMLELISALIMNLFAGDGQYTPSTPQYKAVCAVLEGLDSLAGALHIPLSKLLAGSTGLTQLIKPLLYNNSISDKAAVINLT